MIRKKIKESFPWLKLVKQTNFPLLAFCALIVYFAFNFVFSLIYFYCDTLGDKSFFDYFYFSNVTTFTVGYGDIFPITVLGKVIVIVQMGMSSLLLALFIAILTTKLFYPKDTIIFSKRIFIDEENLRIGFRILSIHSEPIINPEIRVHYTNHGTGHEIVKINQIACTSQLGFLGKHDYVHTIDVPQKFVDNFKEAIMYDVTQRKNRFKSRFRVTVTISGNNGIQEIVQLHKYYAENFKYGTGFTPIQYDARDRKRRVNYSEFGNFSRDFDRVID